MQKQTPFLVQLKQIFGPSYFVRALPFIVFGDYSILFYRHTSITKYEPALMLQQGPID